ncbi:4-alpha-glucanotransferase, partial [Bifidobacterium pseudocatenulatum]|nr:4-alpha-glucanotransferase [Bifidobacterium pseudocatenulatum]
KFKASKDYQQFYQQNEDWLKAYAAFSYLRDINQSANFMNWGKYATYSEDFFEKLTSESNQLDLYIFVQYLLHYQLSEAVDYCHQLGIALKG